MSYDLFMKPRQGSLSEAEFSSFFSGNPLYQLEMPQAWYQNPDTGVYFLLEYQSEQEADEEGEAYPVALNINYFRPTYFAIEAEPEVARFIQHFDMVVSDPQVDGMGEGEYSSEKFLAGWNRGNEFAYSSILSDPENRAGISALPAGVLRDAWAWNSGKAALQAELGEARFVPSVMFLRMDGTTVTAAVWPDGIPIAVPPVDYFIVVRDALAPRKFLFRKPDQTLVAASEVRPLMEKYVQRQDGISVLDYDQPPAEVQGAVKSLPALQASLEGLSPDSVLDAELVERYSG